MSATTAYQVGLRLSHNIFCFHSSSGCALTASSRPQLDIRSCGFSILRAGPVPTEIVRLAALKRLVVFENQLSGGYDNITSSHIGRWHKLSRYPSDYCQQRLRTETRPLGFSVLRAGRMPTEIGRLAALERLEVNNNKFSGRCDHGERRCEFPHRTMACIVSLLLTATAIRTLTPAALLCCVQVPSQRRSEN